MIVLYDGVCGLCNRLVQFVLKRDRRDVFRFAPLQSDFAKEVLAKHSFTLESLDTMCVVSDYGEPSEKLFCRSDAALTVAQNLSVMWRALGGIGRVLPAFFRDFVYNCIARNRYRIFGKYDACPLPTPDQRAKFLDH